ncbi:hypothetical protein SB725_30555, partial [Pseudomonas sp. SIMBA_041]
DQMKMEDGPGYASMTACCGPREGNGVSNLLASPDGWGSPIFGPPEGDSTTLLVGPPENDKPELH